MTVHVEESIERYFEGRIGLSEDRDALFGHLDRCAPCRGHFDRLAFTHRALAGTRSGVPMTELALIKQSLIPAAAEKSKEARKRLSFPRLAALFAPAAAVVVIALGVLTFPTNLHKEGALVPKGGTTV